MIEMKNKINMKKFTHTAVIASTAVLFAACSADTFNETGVVETDVVEILTPTCEVFLTTDELTNAGLSTLDEYVLWDGLNCKIVHTEYEEALGYESTITPVRYHYYPETQELYTYKSQYLVQERFVTYNPDNIINIDRLDYVTKETYHYLKVDCYFMKDGNEYHLMAERPLFDEYEQEDGSFLYAMTDPNGQFVVKRVDENGDDIDDELLYSPSSAMTYTMEVNYLDLDFDYGD